MKLKKEADDILLNIHLKKKKKKGKVNFTSRSIICNMGRRLSYSEDS